MGSVCCFANFKMVARYASGKAGHGCGIAVCAVFDDFPPDQLDGIDMHGTKS